MQQLYYVLDLTKEKRWDVWKDFEISLHKTIKLYRTTEREGKLINHCIIYFTIFYEANFKYTWRIFFKMINTENLKSVRGLIYYSRHVIPNYQKVSSCKKQLNLMKCGSRLTKRNRNYSRSKIWNKMILKSLEGVSPLCLAIIRLLWAGSGK